VVLPLLVNYDSGVRRLPSVDRLSRRARLPLGQWQIRTSRSAAMRIFSVWFVEFFKLLGRRRLHPLNAECPICHQMVRLHCNRAGRRHLFAHARAYSRALYEGSRYCAHYTANIKCVGSNAPARFDPRPNEPQRFKGPNSLGLNG
jgi:hypothetical protein